MFKDITYVGGDVLDSKCYSYRIKDTRFITVIKIPKIDAHVEGVIAYLYLLYKIKGMAITPNIVSYLKWGGHTKIRLDPKLIESITKVDISKYLTCIANQMLKK